MILDLEQFDSNSIVGFGNLDIELFGRSLDPVVIVRVTVLSFVEGFDCRAGSKVGIFAWHCANIFMVSIKC